MTELALFGKDLFGNVIKQNKLGPVAERFTIPPFSILDARSGEWQERKRAWISLGIKGEIGRQALGKNTLGDLESRYKENEKIPDSVKKILAPGSGTSIFDPTLCELIYRWFCPNDGQVIDPFAGGSVRGIVASCLGLNYWGCDLSQSQIWANKKQADEIGCDPSPIWIVGDSMEELEKAPDADLIFSCPPYGDLEKYSNDPRDLSNMEWHTFVGAYNRIVMRACKKLKENRFACFVVGDFRDNRGFYRDFVSTTINAFKQQKLELYNEAILVTSVGSASMRITRQFESGRKFAKTHQNVLIFCKGDWREATKNLEGGENNR